MSIVKIADIIEPITFAAYIREAIIEKSALIGSGLVTQSDQLNALVSGGGRNLNMPLWHRIDGESEVLSDQTPLTPLGITTGQDVATMHLRGNAWGANEYASALAGDSAIDAISSMITEYWIRQEQKILISTLTGVFESTEMKAEHVHDASAEVISAANTLDAKQLLGDAADQIAMIVMHSKTYTTLQKNDLIEYFLPSEGGKPIPTYLGYRLIFDDTVPFDSTTGIYTTYLLANGVIARGDGTPVDLTAVELDRDSLQGVDYIINRRAFVLHPFGVKWNGVSVAGTTPTNAELEMGANWTRVYNKKHVGMVAMKHLV